MRNGAGWESRVSLGDKAGECKVKKDEVRNWRFKVASRRWGQAPRGAVIASVRQFAGGNLPSEAIQRGNCPAGALHTRNDGGARGYSL
jgi:hypothetical protein